MAERPCLLTASFLVCVCVCVCVCVFVGIFCTCVCVSVVVQAPLHSVVMSVFIKLKLAEQGQESSFHQLLGRRPNAMTGVLGKIGDGKKDEVYRYLQYHVIAIMLNVVRTTTLYMYIHRLHSWTVSCCVLLGYWLHTHALRAFNA